MRAALLYKPQRIETAPLAFEEIPIPSMHENQLLIRVTACGVCRSNLHMIEGDWVRFGVPSKSPIIPGHEVVGRVVEVTKEVTRFQPGDLVGVQPLWSSCGACEFCLEGKEQLCPGREITGETVDGGFAQYMLAEARHVYSIPNGLKDSEAAPLFCPGVTAYGAVKKARLSPGKRVAVFGIGGVGHMVLQLAKLSGTEVIAVSRSDIHLTLAEELGATSVVNLSKGNEETWLREIGLVDSSIVFAPSTEVARFAMKATKPGGVIVLGVWADLGEFPFVDEKIVIGSAIGSRDDMNAVINIAAAGKIRARTEEFALESANEVLMKLKSGLIEARAVLIP